MKTILLTIIYLIYQSKLLSVYCGITGECQELNNCSGHGQCSGNKCICYEGWSGAAKSYGANALYAAFDCSARNCPSGVSWADIPDIKGYAHRLQQEECSGKGLCDRSTGRCKCYANFAGPACERMKCPNDCSGHGRCLSMRQLAQYSSALPLTISNYAYSELQIFLNSTSKTWDANKIYGCLCDSSWEVGINSNQTQQSEWFGADCSLRHCPSGDNPLTSKVETDCFNVTAVGTNITGAHGNICHVDCSNLGICDYSTGICNCFSGFYGLACNSYEALHTQVSISPSGAASSVSSLSSVDFGSADAITFSDV